MNANARLWSVQDEQEAIEFSLLENMEPMIEVTPLSKAREAYDRMMAAKVRFRIVLVPDALEDCGTGKRPKT